MCGIFEYSFLNKFLTEFPIHIPKLLFVVEGWSTVKKEMCALCMYIWHESGPIVDISLTFGYIVACTA